MEYIFDTPYEFDGKTYDKIEFDLDKLSGADISAAKKQFQAAGNFSPMVTADLDFCAILLCRLIKQPDEFMLGMPARDYSKLAQQVSTFLLS